MYNDQPDNAQPSSSYGHTKGVVGVGDAGEIREVVLQFSGHVPPVHVDEQGARMFLTILEGRVRRDVDQPAPLLVVVLDAFARVCGLGDEHLIGNRGDVFHGFGQATAHGGHEQQKRIHRCHRPPAHAQNLSFALCKMHPDAAFSGPNRSTLKPDVGLDGLA